MLHILDQSSKLHLLNHIERAVHVRPVAAERDVHTGLEHPPHRSDAIAGVGVSGRIRDAARARLGNMVKLVALEP